MAGLETNSKTDLIILGAGVIGLTVAYLAATDPDATFTITVIARDMPEDMDSQAWASPFAVCHPRSHRSRLLINLRAQIGLLSQQLLAIDASITGSWLHCEPTHHEWPQFVH